MAGTDVELKGDVMRLRFFFRNCWACVQEDERFSSSASGMATPVSGSGGRPIDTQGMRRVAETSIFGLTDKRRPEPLR